MFLLDTNVVSELRPGKSRPCQTVLDWAGSVRFAEQYISVITLMELEIGVQRLEQRVPPQGGRLRIWLNQLDDLFAGRILPIDKAAARRCAGLHVPDTAPSNDALIAATALTHGLTLVTRNVGDFAKMGVKLLNPWQEQP